LTSHKLIDNLPNLEKVKKDLHAKWKEKYSNLDRKEEPGDMNEDGNEKVLYTNTGQPRNTVTKQSKEDIPSSKQEHKAVDCQRGGGSKSTRRNNHSGSNNNGGYGKNQNSSNGGNTNNNIVLMAV
jgi:hypothetical protein